MQWIFDAIAKYTGLTEQADILGVYDFMADSVRTFNGLSPADWKREAAEALAAWRYVNTDEGRAYMAALEAEYA